MRLKILSLTIVALFLVSGCAKTHMGKVDLSDGKPPAFLKVGQTTPAQVISVIGEPLGYRKIGERSAMIYVSYFGNYMFLFFGEIIMDRAYRLDLVFENGVLIKAEVKREGLGFDMYMDARLLRLLLS